MHSKLDKLYFQFKKDSKQVTDPLPVKAVHDLRVVTRRLRSAIWILKQGSKINVDPRLKQELQRWTRVLGKRRQIDTLLRNSSQFHLQVAALKKKQQIANQELVCTLTPKSREQIITHLKSICHALKSGKKIHQKPVLQKAYERFFPLVDNWSLNNRALHQVRVSSKKMRYILEFFDLPAKPLQHLQSYLGKVHDLQVLKATLIEKPHSKPRKSPSINP